RLVSPTRGLARAGIHPQILLKSHKREITSRAMTTTTSRLASLIYRNYNTSSVIDVRRRW
ncbi:MAG: hypothetical protein O3A92_17270, partial [Verrucomicrobia bacterium]|nr:hypothetical protein [Verrucomicrobiota bacterium]